MSACPTVNPDHLCQPEIVLPPSVPVVSICAVGAVPEPPPIVGIETGGGTQVCYLVDGQIVSYVVEVIRDDNAELSDVTLMWHDVAGGASSLTAPDGPVVACEPSCDSTCVQLADGTFGPGSVSYAVLPDGSLEVLGVSPAGATVAEAKDCC